MVIIVLWQLASAKDTFIGLWVDDSHSNWFVRYVNMAYIPFCCLSIVCSRMFCNEYDDIGAIIRWNGTRVFGLIYLGVTTFVMSYDDGYFEFLIKLRICLFP